MDHQVRATRRSPYRACSRKQSAVMTAPPKSGMSLSVNQALLLPVVLILTSGAPDCMGDEDIPTRGRQEKQAVGCNYWRCLCPRALCCS